MLADSVCVKNGDHERGRHLPSCFCYTASQVAQNPDNDLSVQEDRYYGNRWVRYVATSS